MLNVIVTSGGCIEPIDSIRGITNSSSGKLGSMITDEIVRQYDKNVVGNIYYICSRKSILPSTTYSSRFNINIVYADSTQEIYNQMKNLLTNTAINITHVIHARAISDYEVDFVTSTSILRGALEYEDWGYALDNCYCDELLESSSEEDSNFEVCKSCAYSPDIQMNTKGKISSYHDDLIIKLKKTPKIITYIKQWKPDVKLFGFKLLDNVPQDALFTAARKQMEKCHCDYVVANDISQINNSQHIAHILDTKGNVTTCNTKQEIANIITRIVMNDE